MKEHQIQEIEGSRDSKTSHDLNRSDRTEPDQTCGSCEEILNSEYIVCEICQINCHMECACTFRDTGYCISCFGINKQKTTELKSREVKLKNTEEGLRMRERVSRDKAKYYKRLTTHCEKLESRNKVLEITLNTLITILDTLESQNYSTRTKQTYTSPVENEAMITSQPDTQSPSIIMAMQEKVATFVLKQIDQQLDRLKGKVLNDEQPTKDNPSSKAASQDLIDLTNDRNEEVGQGKANSDFIKVPRNSLA